MHLYYNAAEIYTDRDGLVFLTCINIVYNAFEA